MPTENLRLGLDIGAIFAKAALLDGDGSLLEARVVEHHGDPTAVTRALLQELASDRPGLAIGVTGSIGQKLAPRLGLVTVNEVAALMAAAARSELPADFIIDAGGASLSLLELGPGGRLRSFETNSLCAAGTGSFLDEQAVRLGLDPRATPPSPEAAPEPPAIAARCSVFAKSDLIHRQQEGYGREDLWRGLCKGLSRTMATTLFKGRSPSGRGLLLGGVALNREVAARLQQTLGTPLSVPTQPQLQAAIGAALEASVPIGTLHLGALADDASRDDEARRPALALDLSHFPDFATLEEFTDEAGNELRLSHNPGPVWRCYLGLDIGSTSTKLLLLGEDLQVLADVYRRTSGDPIGAAGLLFQALRRLEARLGIRLDILGSATTGSGRTLVGAVIGADLQVNEISAHVRGALHTDPEVETIFEIGGQDAKYIQAQNGRLRNSNMNFVCAAGTGSFVEEVCRKLGFGLTELGDAVMGVQPPHTSERCTVFMEQDAARLLRSGYDRREVMGAVLYSVASNYLNKVVGKRPVSRKRVFFQGATARNRGLVAAFEKLLGVPVVVSPFCHVMGAFGAALLLREHLQATGHATTFAGLDLPTDAVSLSHDTCTLCVNNCAITTASVPGRSEHPSWGYLCGREPGQPMKTNAIEYALFRRQSQAFWRDRGPALPPDAPVLHMPRALLHFSLHPFWKAFFASLGVRLALSATTDRQIIDQSADWCASDYCLPLKLAHGHLRNLVEAGAQRIFVPYLISDEANPKTTQSHYCPYNLGLPGMLRAALELNGLSASLILGATIDFRWTPDIAARRLQEDLGPALGRTRKDFARAWTEGLAARAAYAAELEDAGRQRLAEISASGRPAVVILGRPYNLYDRGANLDLPAKLARLGVEVIPMDALPLADQPLAPEYRNMFWNFGRRVLEASALVANTPNLFALYLSNFSCGPDSFVQTYAERVMAGKPMLILEVDEHGADAGYLTRLEAFRDVILGASGVSSPAVRTPTAREGAELPSVRTPTAREGVSSPSVRTPTAREGVSSSSVRTPTAREGVSSPTLWIPAMHEVCSPFMAAVLRSLGRPSKVLPLETRESFDLGRSRCRGGECLPCPATLGAFLATLKAEGGDPANHALFMPTAEGPCRFGQYCTLQEQVLRDLGLGAAKVVSWNSTDSYDGTSMSERRRIWKALALGDVLFKMRCRLVAKEKRPGQTEDLYLESRERLAQVIEQAGDLEGAVKEVRNRFLQIPTLERERPLVGVVGEIYVRNNAFCNQGVVRAIEAAGGEAWVAPFSEWIIYTAWMEAWFKGFRRGGFLERMGGLIKNRFLAGDAEAWHRAVSPILDQRMEPPIEETVRAGAAWLPIDFEGESIITIGRTIEFAKRDGASLVLNAAPFGCMPGAMTSGILKAVERDLGIPVVPMFYDGQGDINGLLESHLSAILRQRDKQGMRVDFRAAGEQ